MKTENPGGALIDDPRNPTLPPGVPIGKCDQGCLAGLVLVVGVYGVHKNYGRKI